MIITLQDLHLPFPWSDVHKHSTSQQSVGNQSTERNERRTSTHSYTVTTSLYRDWMSLRCMHHFFFLEITCILRLFWYIFRGDKMIHICVSTGWGGIEVRAGFFSVVHICYLYIIVFGYNSSRKTSMFANSRHLMHKMCSNSSHVQLWSC